MKTDRIAMAISALALLCSAACLILLLTGGGAEKDKGGNVQYVMYVGTIDKDTNRPEHTQEEARDIVDRVCLKHFEGYTLQDATGSWTDETGEINHGYTLVCYFDDTNKDTVYQAADEILRELNQNIVLIEEDEIAIEYYGGK